MQKYANLVELEKCCQTHIFLQNFVLIQPRTSPPKICKIFEKCIFEKCIFEKCIFVKCIRSPLSVGIPAGGCARGPRAAATGRPAPRAAARGSPRSRGARRRRPAWTSGVRTDASCGLASLKYFQKENLLFDVQHSFEIICKIVYT